MTESDIIAAVSTAPGRGGIGVVRISGPQLELFLRGVVSRPLAPRSATLADFVDAQGSAIDRGIALYFPAPHSYTGEDVLELHGHGGPVVLQLLLKRCLELGARPAQPGEFTRRAFLNDKKIHVSNVDAFEKSLFVTGFASERQSQKDVIFKRFVDLTRKTLGVRRTGAAC